MVGDIMRNSAKMDRLTEKTAKIAPRRSEIFKEDEYTSSKSSSSSSSVHSGENCQTPLPLPSTSHGLISVCGRRREMEDAVTVEPGFVTGNPTRCDFYGVYDGHGGYRVAQSCQRKLHRLVALEIERSGLTTGGSGSVGSWREVMREAFKKMDDEVEREETLVNSPETMGSTAVVAIVCHREIVIANCGDSRAVLYSGGLAMPLSRDHKPDREDELKRVEAAGGRVINWDGYRVLGVLATSRSIGDHYLKPFVISDPEVTVVKRTGADEFLILASDGIWDVLTNHMACEVVRRCLAGRVPKKFTEKVNGGPVAEAAAMLAKLAMARGSKDNISAVVVVLSH